MKLRFHAPAAIVAGGYAAGAVLLATGEMRRGGCDGVCLALATLPEFLLLFLLPNEWGYARWWQDFLVWIFAPASIGLNAFILYVVFGGVAWWRGL